MTWSPNSMDTPCEPVVSSQFFPKKKQSLGVFVGSKGFFSNRCYGNEPPQRLANMLANPTKWIKGKRDLAENTNLELSWAKVKCDDKEENVLKALHGRARAIADTLSGGRRDRKRWPHAIDDAYREIQEDADVLTAMEDPLRSLRFVVNAALLLHSKRDVTGALVLIKRV